jgi:hypothetical protein
MPVSRSQHRASCQLEILPMVASCQLLLPKSRPQNHPHEPTVVSFLAAYCTSVRILRQSSWDSHRLFLWRSDVPQVSVSVKEPEYILTLCESSMGVIPLHVAGFTDVLCIGSHFTIQFRNAKEQPSSLMLHSPSFCLTIHIPSHSEDAERVSRLPLMCPDGACVTTP